MAMKPETQYYVLLGKVSSAVQNSILREGVLSFEFDDEAEQLMFLLRVNGKMLIFDYPINTTKTEQQILDELMGLYNVEL